jgi:hypothetical protein
MEGVLEVSTTDGEGIPVVYQNPTWRIATRDGEPSRLEICVKHGRGNRPIAFRFVSTNGELMHEHVISPEQRGTVIPATQPWIVGLGSERLNLDQSAMKSVKGALPEYTTTSLIRIEDVPELWQAYQGADLLVFSSYNELLNRSLSLSHAAAISTWIENGGRCALTLGLHADSWFANPKLASLIPGTFVGVVADCEQGPFESFIGSKNPLPRLSCAVFDLLSGKIELPAQTPGRVSFPMVAKWAHGSGKVSFLSLEIDGPELSPWNSRPDVLKMLYDDQWEKKDAKTDKLVYQGYDDLSGQLNAMLDYFPQLTLGNLTSISLIAVCVCLIIGPLDYFLISRTWRLPRVTWLTLALCSLGGCVIAALTAKAWKPTLSSINSLELLDIDYASQTLTGRGFAHYYGGDRGSFDFAAHRRGQGVRKSSESSAKPISLDWFGQPGKGIGGFDSTVATDRSMPRYRVLLSSDATEVGASSRESVDARPPGMYGVGIATAGTKAMVAQWLEPIDIPTESHALSQVAGQFDLLEGRFSNPLDVDLLDGILVYRRRAYTLATRLRPGDQVTLSLATLPKDVVRRLQRRQNVGGEERSSPWNPASNNQLDRLLEMLTFHQAAGGSNYTSLYNRYLGALDCSDVIQLDRAVLLAEVADGTIAWSVHRDSTPVQAMDGQRKTFVRLFIPVARPSKAAPLVPPRPTQP